MAFRLIFLRITEDEINIGKHSIIVIYTPFATLRLGISRYRKASRRYHKKWPQHGAMLSEMPQEFPDATRLFVSDALK